MNSPTDRNDASSRGVGANPRIVATIEARMASTRLPGKVLEDIGGQPMLAMIIERLKSAQTLDVVCVATTLDPRDDGIESLARELGVAVFRGSEDDVLSRVLGAARSVGADVIVEVTGDCPLVDPSILDGCVLSFLSRDVHMSSVNARTTSFPLGLDLKVFSTELLAQVDGLTDDPRDREHVSLYIYEVEGRYAVIDLVAPARLRRPEWRWTVDTEEDLAFVRAVVGALGSGCTSKQLIEFLDCNPQVVAINSEIRQKAARW